jgi:hypothetical protein
VGYEFRIKTVPAIENLGDAVAPALEKSGRIIDSSLLVVASEKLGIASESTIGTSWPHCCDLMLEESCAIYAIGHNNIGCQMIYRYVENLKAIGDKDFRFGDLVLNVNTIPHLIEQSRKGAMGVISGIINSLITVY